MKIIYVTGPLLRAGAELHLINVVLRLKKKGIRPIIFCIGYKGELSKILEKNDIKVYSSQIFKFMTKNKIFKIINYFLNLPNLIFIILKFRPHIIHCFLPSAYIIGGIAAVITRVPIKIMSRRSRNFYQKNYYFVRFFEKLLHKRMDFILANSKPVYKDLLSENVRKDKLRLIYNGIKINTNENKENKKGIRKKLEINDNVVLLNITANLIRYKGHEDLITALAIVKENIQKEWKLICVGQDFGIKPELEMLIEKYKLKDKIIFIGSYDKPYELMSVSDIGVLSSHEEGFSNSVLEYMANSLPVIATNVGGNKFALNDNECGMIVKKNNPQNLGKALSMLINDKNLRIQKGKAGKKRVKKFFDIDNCVQQYLNLYTNENFFFFKKFK